MKAIAPILLLLSFAALAACETPPLPEEDIPQDFLFTYTLERFGGETAEPATGPRRIHLSLDVAGSVNYEVDHVKPKPATNAGEFRVEEMALRSFYDALRAVDLYELPESYEGNEPRFGTRTFFVIGRNTPRTIVAKNTAVPALDPLEQQLLDLVPAEVLAYPRNAEQSVALDLRTGFFHLGGCPEAKGIPPESRRGFDDPWAALNAGFRPAECCKPLENFR